MGLRQSLRVATGALLLACGLQFAHANSDPHTIVFGVAPGPYGDMVKQAIAPTLKEKGYKVVVREFSDYVQPNMALSNGSIDANLFQHSLYFDKFTADKGLKLSKLPKDQIEAQVNEAAKILELEELLDRLRLLCKGKTEPDQSLCQQFNQATDDGKNMSAYSELLSEAINSILDAKEESDIDSLFKLGGTTALLSSISGLDDFELICFLVVQ